MGGVWNSDTSLGSRRELFCEDKSEIHSVCVWGGSFYTHTLTYMERRKYIRKTNELRNIGTKGNRKW